MIKMRSKKIFSSVVILGVLLSPSVWAVSSNNMTGPQNNANENGLGEKRQQVKVTQNVCDNISKRADELSQKIASQEDNLKSHQEQRLANWDQKINQVDMKLVSLRAAWDKNRDQQFSKLIAKAETDEQKKAVSDFENTTKAAITTRRSAIDGAIIAFRKGVSNAISERQVQVDKMLFDLEAARSAAFIKAKNDCSNGANAQTIRTSLKTALQAGRAKLQADRQNETKIGSTVASLVQVRQQAFEKAFTDFRGVMEKARTELKKAFPEG